ncbi:MAG: hypothetical protein P8099_20900, partial [Gemmatimonadota bacterium]
WTRIDDGIPEGAYTRTIREDPTTPGLLFAGTETGVYVSLDDGAHWQSLQLNLPKSSVRDLAIRDGDLVAATHGRSFWVLDDIQPLRDWAKTHGQQVHLFQPRTPVRFAGYGGGYRPRNAGQNPPNGVIVDWYLATRPDSVVTLEFLDSAGTVVRSFNSEEKAPSRPAFRNAEAAAQRDARLEAREQARIAGLADSASFAIPDSIVPKREGLNRFVWDLQYPDADRVPGIIDDYGTRAGPVVPPGTYTARLTVGGQTYTQNFQVKEDPRVNVTDAQLAAQFDLAMKVRQSIDTIAASIKRIDELEGQLDTWKSAVTGKPFAARVDSAAGVVRDSLESVRAALVCVHCHADESSLNYPIQLYNKLISFNMMVLSAHAQPTDADMKVYADLRGKLDAQLARLDAAESGPVAALNGLLDQLGVQRIGGQ